MHMVIRLIAYGENKKEAFDKARDILDNLCGEDGQPFDYYTTFDDNTSTISGKARWGAMPHICEADSKEGKKLIDEGMQYTKEAFLENIKIARKVLKNKTDKQIFEDADWDKDMVKYRFHCLGAYKGANIFLYDQDGEGIRDPKHLANVLSKWACIYEKENKQNPYAEHKIFVVPADVHY